MAWLPWQEGQSSYTAVSESPVHAFISKILHALKNLLPYIRPEHIRSTHPSQTSAPVCA